MTVADVLFLGGACLVGFMCGAWWGYDLGRRERKERS